MLEFSAYIRGTRNIAMNRNIVSPAPAGHLVSYRSILEGNPPNMLFWQLEQLNPFRTPENRDFSVVDGHSVFNAASAHGEAKAFASRNEPWLRKRMCAAWSSRLTSTTKTNQEGAHARNEKSLG